MAYAVLFLVIFSETGLVFTPFLPGDSLLFAAGAFSAVGSFNIFLLSIHWAAAFLGDTVNYWIGHYFGQKYGKFIYYNATGGFVWVLVFTLLGYFVGNIPGVKANFPVVIVAIIILSVITILVEFARSRVQR